MIKLSTLNCKELIIESQLPKDLIHLIFQFHYSYYQNQVIKELHYKFRETDNYCSFAIFIYRLKSWKYSNTEGFNHYKYSFNRIINLKYKISINNLPIDNTIFIEYDYNLRDKSVYP